MRSVAPSRRATALETVFVEVPEAALEAYEAALAQVCGTVGFFFADEETRLWRVEGVKDQGAGEDELVAALALAALVSGVDATLERSATAADGWLAKIQASFPEQRVGERFAIRGTHLPDVAIPGRLVVRLDAGVAFGSGEHGSTRGCLIAFERVARRRPARVLDLGTGSGVLAMAAAQWLRRPVLATDIDPWSVRTARANATLNGLTRVRFVQADGWRSAALAGRRYDLVFANILARPLCLMAAQLAAHLAPGGTAILAGLLDRQARMVISAHRRQGLALRFTVRDGDWTTLVMGRR